jgi:hypothetical protein
MTMNTIDMLRTALPAVASFGAVYLALRFGGTGRSVPTPHARLSQPADGTPDVHQAIRSSADAQLGTRQTPIRIELIVDRPLLGPSIVHINCHGSSSVHFEAREALGRSELFVPAQAPEESNPDDLPL